MNISNDIIDREPRQVATLFRHWEAFMEENLFFWPLREDGFDIHTKSHCERVLFLALKLATARKVGSRALEALAHAAIFHDTRRKDNFLDQGHGDRAAVYYRAFCSLREITFHPEACAAIKFHDRDDALGEAYIRDCAPSRTDEWLEVYRDLKDADALDRFRLGPWALDASFLRTAEARAMVPFAQKLVETTIDPAILRKTMDMTRPFADKFKRESPTPSSTTDKEMKETEERLKETEGDKGR